MKLFYFVLFTLFALISAEKFCMPGGLTCGSGIKPCCPGSYCSSKTSKCEAEKTPNEWCQIQGKKCGPNLNHCCSGYHCDNFLTKKCVSDQVCRIEGWSCGKDLKPCCPGSHCNTKSKKCVAGKK